MPLTATPSAVHTRDYSIVASSLGLLLLLAACLRRCPNPAACRHDPTLLATSHPDTRTGSPLSWADYVAQLCSYQDGYQGILCGGGCIKGYGTTAPFKCNRCLGTQTVPSVANGYSAGPAPGPARISAVYFVYWFVLTCWLLFTVRSFVLASSPQQPGKAGVAAAAPAGPVVETVDGPVAVGSAAAKDMEGGRGWGVQATGPPPKESARSLDITKVRRRAALHPGGMLRLPACWPTGGACVSACAPAAEVCQRAQTSSAFWQAPLHGNHHSAAGRLAAWLASTTCDVRCCACRCCLSRCRC